MAKSIKFRTIETSEIKISSQKLFFEKKKLKINNSAGITQFDCNVALDEATET